MPTFPAIDPTALAALQKLFFANFEEFDELGAAVAVWQGEDELLSLAHGSANRGKTRSWTEETLVPIWSCTKGPAVATVLLALETSGHSLSEPVATIWPEFARAGKGDIRFAELLSHQAGLAALDDPPSIFDYRAVVHSLERQAPLWNTGHGYHPRTYGFLLEEIVRRLTGAESLGNYWREKLAAPLALDVWIGLPASEHDRVAEVLPGRLKSGKPLEEERFYRAFSDASSLPARAFASPRGLHAVAEMNEPAVWSAGFPAMGGVASARGLAAFYAFLARGGTAEGRRFFGEDMMRRMASPLVQGHDQVLLRETAFAAGFMVDPIDEQGGKQRQLFGPNTGAFGHPGAGGSLAFADPETGIGFAYVMNQMEQSAFPTEKARRLVRALYAMP